MSATVTEAGSSVGKSWLEAKLGVVAPGTVVLSSAETVLSNSFATIRSGWPSPLTSDVVTDIGPLSVAKVC
jgi:hypothetical protein